MSAKGKQQYLRSLLLLVFLTVALKLTALSEPAHGVVGLVMCLIRAVWSGPISNVLRACWDID